MYHFEVVKNMRESWKDYFRRPQRYHWRIRHYGDIICTSETYSNYDDALAVATHLHSKVKGSTIKTIEE